MNDNSPSATLALAMDLIRRPSVTPEDAGCNALMMDRLRAIGFVCEEINSNGVRNFWARLGDEAPVVCLAGHTDVVPTGPAEHWRFPPFEPSLSDGMLYGRGAADMKGSLAAMVTACERLMATCQRQQKRLQGSIAFLITSDEEGPATDGTRHVIDVLQRRGEHIDYCIVGEPSSQDALGDVIKIGRRGSLHGHLQFHGIQGHIAYPHLARNPIHEALPPLQALCAETWDEGNEAFPPTSFQISNLQAGTGADNIIPGELKLRFNFRYSTEVDAPQLRARTHAILDRFELPYTLDWVLSGEPFLTRESRLIEETVASIRALTGRVTQRSTSGGTSDGRFIAPTGTQLVELGPRNATIHKIDECVSVADLEQLSELYEDILRRMLVDTQSDSGR